MNHKQHAHQIIHTAAAAAAAAAGALAQGAVIGADTVILTPIHVGMIIALGDLFNIPVDKAMALSLLGTAIGAGLGVGVAKGIFGIFPGAGNVVNASITFAHTEALGWFVYNYFKDQAKK